MSRVPRIRFKGFEEDWEQRKLVEVAIFNPKSKLPSTFEYVDLESVIGTEIVSHSTETINTAPSRAQRLAKKGDIFYQTVRPYQKNNYLFEKDRGNYVFSTGYAQLRPFVNERFLFYLIQNGNFVNMVLYNCTGTSYPAINSSDLRRIDIYLSRNSTEQKCIGNTIKSLDHLITLHQRKLEKLKIIKKSMLENLFPQNGEKTPKIRFSGFTKDWEQRKLGDIVREVTRVDENSNAPVMMITANDGFIEQSERYSTDNAGKSLKKYILLKKWELAYNHGASKIRPFGSCFALTRATDIRIPFVYHCFSALADNPEFLEQTLNGKNVENQLRKIVSSGARMDGLLNISFQEYTSIFIRCPIRKEQDKIAILIKSLNHLITLHQSKLDKLQKIKKSMLESMFV